MKPSVLITGASSGIGAATARRLLTRGFEVFGTSRDPDSVGPDAPAVRWIPMDVGDPESVRDGVTQVLGGAADRVKQLDALVCNAGFGVFGSVEELSIEDAWHQFDINYFGTLRTLRAVIPSMRAARQGRIVIISSLAAHAAIPFQAHYSATKSALGALGLALKNELHPYGISVSLVEPGDIKTAFNDATDFGEHDHSPYGSRIGRCEGVIRDAFANAPGPDLVARTIERALTARWPRIRYAVGPESIAVPFGRRLLPDSLFLRLIRGHFGI